MILKSAILLLILLACGANLKSEKKMEKTLEKSVYGFTVNNIDGKAVPLKEYSGKALLIVNTASRCGYTPQYEGLESLYKKYKPRGLEVLGFPSNDFGGQEPGSNAEIKTFCETRFKVSFSLFEKGPVSGEKIQPLFLYLTQTAKPEIQGGVRWNFEKFVIDRNGRLIGRFRSKDAPDSAALAAVLEQALQPPVQ